MVDDEKTAKECLQYMKDQRIGVATFIPLETIKTKPGGLELSLVRAHVIEVDSLRWV